MKHIITAAVLSFAALPALAGQCPMDMSKIDAAMATAELSEAEMSEVMALRAEGEALHNSGDHAASVETLAQAKAILGID